MIELHYAPGNASMTPHMVLRELGIPFTLRLVDRAAHAHKSPAYLALNPNGLIPTLVDGAQVLYETGAIVLHLADTHPQAGLAPAPGSAARPEFLKWLFWLSSSVQPYMTHYFYGDRMVAPGNAEGAAQVKAAAEAKLAGLFDQLETRLAAGGPWLLGEAYSVLDPYAFMLSRWTRGMARPARTLPALAAFQQRMLARPAVQQVFAAEGLAQPYV